MSRVRSGCPYSKIGVVRTVQNSHVTVFCSIPLVFRKSGVLQTVNGAAWCRDSQNRTLDTVPFSRDWKFTDFCIQWTLHTCISTYTYYMLFERQGSAKATSKNVAKAYLDIQITAAQIIIRLIYYANNV